MTIGNQRDFATGVMYILVGGAVSWIASSYDMGTPSSMGPGFFPFWLGLLLAFLGAIVTVASLKTGGRVARISGWDLRSGLLVFGSVIIFGATITSLGMVVAVAAVAIISSFASHEFSWRTTLANSAVITLLCLLLFGYGLKLQFPIFPAFISG